jgi:hypothetical protein
MATILVDNPHIMTAAATPVKPVRSAGTTSPRFVDFSRSGPYFAIMLAITAVAFWPTYVSLPLRSSSLYTHLHAVTATAWMLLLIAQPMAIRTRRPELHRTLGRVSYGVVTAVLVSMVLLAHHRIRTAPPEAYAIQTYVLYLQVSLALLFGLAYALAVRTRRRVALHARFMVCTGITLIDPITIRLMFWIDPTPSWNYQWFTFGLTDLALAMLVWTERHSPRGRWVFPSMLGLFILLQAVALLQLTESWPWQAFARWFRALPLT